MRGAPNGVEAAHDADAYRPRDLRLGRPADRFAQRPLLLSCACDGARQRVARLGKQTLPPGMPVEVLIKKRERTALDYLVEPMRDAFARAWRED